MSFVGVQFHSPSQKCVLCVPLLFIETWNKIFECSTEVLLGARAWDMPTQNIWIKEELSVVEVGMNYLLHILFIESGSVNSGLQTRIN